jgi:hypothetical protein
MMVQLGRSNAKRNTTDFWYGACKSLPSFQGYILSLSSGYNGVCPCEMLLNIWHSVILSYPKTSQVYVTSFRYQATKVYPIKHVSARKRLDGTIYDKELHFQGSTR